MRSHGLIDCTFNNIWTTVFHKRRRTHFGTRIEICAAHWCRWRSELASSIPVGPTQNCTWRWTSTICIIIENEKFKFVPNPETLQISIQLKNYEIQMKLNMVIIIRPEKQLQRQLRTKWDVLIPEEPAMRWRIAGFSPSWWHTTLARSVPTHLTNARIKVSLTLTRQRSMPSRKAFSAKSRLMQKAL